MKTHLTDLTTEEQQQIHEARKKEYLRVRKLDDDHILVVFGKEILDWVRDTEARNKEFNL